MTTAELTTFLIDTTAKGYSAGNLGKKGPDGENEIRIPETMGPDDHLQLIDKFVGGEPFSDWTQVQEDGVTRWTLSIFGKVSKDVDDKQIDEVYSALRQATSSPPEEFPVRGPKLMKIEAAAGTYTYFNFWRGDLEEFQGEEKMTLENGTHGEEVYSATYMGGIVNVREGE